jgi:hypothetical protein
MPAESGRRRTVTPYTFCANVIVDWILRDIRVGRIANTGGVSFIFEAGNNNNAEAKWSFGKVCKKYHLAGLRPSASFLKRAAEPSSWPDLYAFYSRPHGLAMEAALLSERGNVRPNTMLNIITESVPHRAFVATGFGG